MSEKLSEQVMDIVNDALACALGSVEIADLVKKVAALEQQLAEKDAEIARLRARMEQDADSWDEKNYGVETPKECSADYIYGYNAGCAETFRACAYRTSTIGAALAETPAVPLTALALPEDDVPDAASETEV